MIAKLEGHKVMRTKTETNTEPLQKWEVHKTIDHQQQNHSYRTDSSLSQRGVGGGLHAFNRRQIFAQETPTEATAT